MPTATSDGPGVALSFANNFWGKDDAGVGPMLERMHGAKQTCDELRAFYSARASIEDDYARKLLSLCRKSLGSQEMGTLKTSLDTVRGEVESIGKQHQIIAAQMKSELEEPLGAFAGGMKERRKIIQNTVEKLLKIKVQQTQMVNKTRDRYEQECLKIKGYLAQGHMVMGQEERKNKAKLEKTQITLATSNTEYEAAVKALEETTARWNREWKAAADKFQDLEEERLDFTKSSLWTFANIASTVCVSDDASCEKIRLSLEKMEVEKDIITFITERGTGQEIPDPPKYINFCRGDIDSQSEASEDESYSVAQFPRNINPAFRSSSPQPSTYESHHDPNSSLARALIHDTGTPQSREATVTPQKVPVMPPQESQQRPRQQPPRGYQPPRANNVDFDPDEFAPVPHDPYPMDGMTMLCRPTASDLSTAPSSSSARPSSRGSHSETSFSSQEPPISPVKQEPPPPIAAPVSAPVSAPAPAPVAEKKVLKKKSGFFQNHSPFGRRKSTKEIAPANTNRNTWHPSNNQSRPPLSNQNLSSQNNRQTLLTDRTASPDPIAANASLALNVGQNVFPVEAHERQKKAAAQVPAEDDDPIALALAELRGVTESGKQSSSRMSADHYHGIATPAPGSNPPSRSGPAPSSNNNSFTASMRSGPPPSYDTQVQRLGVPPPACTSKAMKESSQKFQQQTRTMFNPAPATAADRPGSRAGGYQTRPATRGGNDMPRAASPAPPRSASPRPGSRADPQGYGSQHRSASPNPYSGSQRGAASPSQWGGSQRGQGSPNPYGGSQRGGSAQSPSQMAMTPKRGSVDQGYYNRQNSPNEMARSASPNPYGNSVGSAGGRGDYGRSTSSMDMAVQLAPGPDDGGGGGGGGYGSQRGRGGSGSARPGTSSGNSRAMSFYEGAGAVQPATASRQRSKSVAADRGQFTRDGRSIMHFARAMYMYQAAIPEELGFSKGDMMAVLRHQDDGWWEATVHGGNGQVGLVPSNYLQAI